MTISYSKQVLLKRGNTEVTSTYIGPIGEVTINTDTWELLVHDGVTAGGNLSVGQSGPQGIQGNVGATGVGITTANVTAGNLLITLSNSSVINAGNVVGPQGNTGATSSGAEIRAINFPNGEPGDTAGTIAFHPENGNTYICAEDFVSTEPSTVTAINYDDGAGAGQQYDSISFDLSDSDNSDLLNLLEGGVGALILSNDVTVEVNIDGNWVATNGQGYNLEQNPPYLSFTYPTTYQFQPGDEVEVRFTPIAQAIWVQVNGGQGVDGLVGDTDFTPDVEGDTAYELDIGPDYGNSGPVFI